MASIIELLDKQIYIFRWNVGLANRHQVHARQVCYLKLPETSQNCKHLNIAFLATSDLGTSPFLARHRISLLHTHSQGLH